MGNIKYHFYNSRQCGKTATSILFQKLKDEEYLRNKGYTKKFCDDPQCIDSRITGTPNFCTCKGNGYYWEAPGFSDALDLPPRTFENCLDDEEIRKLI